MKMDLGINRLGTLDPILIYSKIRQQPRADCLYSAWRR